MKAAYRSTIGIIASLLLSSGMVRAAEAIGELDQELSVSLVRSNPNGDCGDCVWPPG